MSTASVSRDRVATPTTRDRWRARIEPVARGFGRVGLTPNALTLIGFGIALLAAWFATQQAWLAAGIAVIVGAVFDLFDGALARATGKVTKFGAFLDSTMDRWGEAVVYIGLAIGLGEVGLSLGMPLAAAAMASAFMVSYVRAKSESLGFTSGRGMASVGLAPREVRIVILSAGLIGAGALSPQAAGSLADGFAGAGGGVIGVWYMVLVGSLALITVLATITTIQRILHVYREAKQQEQQ